MHALMRTRSLNYRAKLIMTTVQTYSHTHTINIHTQIHFEFLLCNNLRPFDLQLAPDMREK